ncbi:ATP-binding protein [uncultured Sphingomonas sp.]|uniref:ATP-binding protein n=1 Tax=uncultured Sphingomonas sp. TaxID=158754 RepID=UPI0025EBDDAD|nr:ATP-binding protein [uncultured Sphingomonas sp.]
MENISARSGDMPNLRAKVLVGIVAFMAAFLLVALLVLVQRSNEERDSALARKQHSYQVVLLTHDVDGALARAEAALGRFVIDGDRRTGTSYYDAWRQAGRLLDDLDRLIRDDSKQAQRMRLLHQLYTRRGQELALPATRANYQQGWPALSLFARAGRSPTLPLISRTLHEVAEAEVTLLDVRADVAAARTDRANTLARLLSVVGVLLALSVLALGYLLIFAFAGRRTARERADSEGDRAAALAHAVEERTLELSEANRRLVEEARTREVAEQKLRQMQKMDAVGQLTGGIAHDFNNMLAVVLGGLEMAKRRVEEQAEEASRHLDSAMEGATRAAALTRRLLSFARAEPLLPAAVEPGQLLRDMSDLVDRTIGERIEVRILSAANVWPVWVDAYQLENAILNLAVNARDAMNGVGRVEMSALNSRLADQEVGTLPAGEYVRMAVSDNGSGISQATLERVFEPFFTTKPVGQGTGLGLSQILGFARQSGGDVAISSVVGQGTTVSIYLPRHQGAGTARPPEPAEPVVAAGTRTATIAFDDVILVVEDDARVRAATGEALKELGYRHVLCGSGAEAIQRLDAGERFGMLMTDVVMPSMTGPELVRTVHTRYPDLRVLFVTGYVGEAGEAENFKGAEVLRKPFTLRALAEALQALNPATPRAA